MSDIRDENDDVKQPILPDDDNGDAVGTTDGETGLDPDPKEETGEEDEDEADDTAA